MSASRPGADAAEDDRAFFGHPRGLSTLFFTEMWERFSYYGLRPLLVLFMSAAHRRGGFGFDADAGVGDRRHLRRVACTWRRCPADGSPTAARPAARDLLGRGAHRRWDTSHRLSRLFAQSKVPFFLGLVLIVLGTGLLKPNISAIVGDLYPEGGARRDAGFSIFYMGINIGAFLGPAGHRHTWASGSAGTGASAPPASACCSAL